MVSTSIKISIIYLLLVVSMTISCKPGKEYYPYGQIDLSGIFMKGGDSSDRKWILKNKVNQIAINPTVDGQAVSITGMQTEQYRRFQWLKQFATDEELTNLTKNPSGNVKAYSFMVLCDRNSLFCKEILEQRLSDKTQFQHYSGCLQMPEYINIFYLRYLSVKLSSGEVARYKNEISKQFTAESWKNIERMSF